MYFVKNDFIDFLHHTSREISRKFAQTRVNLHLRGATPQILDVTKGFIEDMREGKKVQGLQFGRFTLLLTKYITNELVSLLLCGRSLRAVSVPA